jgi:hypothetical protein
MVGRLGCDDSERTRCRYAVRSVAPKLPKVLIVRLDEDDGGRGVYLIPSIVTSPELSVETCRISISTRVPSGSRDTSSRDSSVFRAVEGLTQLKRLKKTKLGH